MSIPYWMKFSSQINYEQNFKNTSIEELEEQFSLGVGFQQISGFIISANHIRRLLVTGIYRFKKSWFVSINQVIDHHAFINANSDDKGIWIQDADVSINKKFTISNHSRLRNKLVSFFTFCL